MRSKKTQLLKGLPKVLLAAFTFIIALSSSELRAVDLPLAAGSPMAGFSFDDQPLLLPIQRNFQMAMLTASSEIGRSCGKMESYGWRMSQSEQQRVNLIFNNTVDRLRALGYVIESQAPSSLSRDVTLFTADRPNKHFIFMWSAGEIGLAMVLCESSPPLTGSMATTFRNTPSVQTFSATGDVVQSRLESPVQSRNAKGMIQFSPIGDWSGDYVCMQGQTGGTLRISSLKGENFQGSFRFYPTPKNRTVPRGSYMVYGQYDPSSHRILINPGKWIQRPKNYYNTIIVGSFDPVRRTFSGFFQGIMGCTSFEAKYIGLGHDETVHKKPKKKAKSKPKATTAKPALFEGSNAAPTASPPSGIPPASDGIKLPDNSLGVPASPSSSATPPVSSPAAVNTTAPPTATAPPPVTEMPAPATPTPTPIAPAAASAPPAAAPPSVPAPTPAPVAPAASVPVPVVPAPPVAPPTATPPASDVAPPATSKAPTSSIKPEPLPHPIVLAGGYFNSTVPQLQPATNYNTAVPQLPATSTFDATVPVIPPVQPLPLVMQMPPPNYVAPPVPEISQASELPLVTEIPQIQPYNAAIPEIQPAQQLAPPQVFTDP